MKHTPFFDRPRHVGQPNVATTDTFGVAVEAVLDSRRLTNDGPYVQEFERRVAELCERRYAVAVSSGTAALEIMLRAADIMGGVLLPAWTFVATAHACEATGSYPHFVDVHYESQCLDANYLDGTELRDKEAILGVHLWGWPNNPTKLAEIVEYESIALLYDAAHALGCTYLGRPLASFGDAAALSFHATKIVTTGEGGAIVTDEPSIYERARRMRNFGYDDQGGVQGWGTNAKMSELHAALGLANLDHLADYIAYNKRLYGHYQEGLAGVPGVTLLPQPEGSNYHYVVIRVGEDCPLSRDELMSTLHRENVLARRYFWPGCHRLPPYNERPQLSLPVTDRLARETLVLPTGTGVAEGEVPQICALIKQAIENGRRSGEDA